MRFRPSALTSIAAGMSLVAAVLCLGQLGAALLGMPGPLEAALGDRHGSVRLADVERRVAIERRPAREVELRTRPSREAARDRDVAATRRAAQGERRRSTRRQGRRGTSRVNSRSRTSPPGASLPQTPSTSPDESTDTSATVVATAPGADSVDQDASRSSAGETSPSRRALLSVASVTVEDGDESGNLQPGSVLRVLMAVSDTAATSTTSAAAATSSTMDLRVKLSQREFETLAARAQSSAASAQGTGTGTGSGAAPLALRARVDVVDSADTAAAGDLRVRLQLASSPTDGSPTAVDAGDAGGRSNAVDVWAPIALTVAGEPAPGECEEDEEQPAATKPSGETTPGEDGETPAEPTATEGAPVEVRLPLAPATTPDPSAGAVTVPLPDEEPTGEPSTPGVDVAVEVTVETTPATEPPADTDVETPAEPATVETDPAP